MRTHVAAALLTVAASLVYGQERFAFPGMLDQHPAIDYRDGVLSDVVTQLRSEVASGNTALKYDGPEGYLRSVLTALHVPVESQILVFSKTGIQREFTSPDNPRAFYFNDRVIVGYIPGAPFLELASHDPRQGTIFQILEQQPNSLHFARPDACLSCHRSANSLDVPGVLVRSNFAGPDGRAMPQLGSFVIDHRSPLSERWGGWYVTGNAGGARHMGNAFVSDMAKPESAITPETVNRSTLDSRVDTSLYPAKTSDVVSLMVFDHQGRAINLLTRLGWEARIAAAAGRPDFSHGDLGDVVRETIDYFLFADEARLDAPIRNDFPFASAFAAPGPRDRQGRSLRDLDLRTRLFKYRCSYMIYSPAFDALPADARAAVFAGIREKLHDPDTLAILEDTVAGFRR